MSRPLRVELASGLYHVTSRGDGREDIYLSDSDGLAWLDVHRKVWLYESAAGRWGCFFARPDPWLFVTLGSLTLGSLTLGSFKT